jgi:thiol:disulfide interchange protein
MKLKQTTLSLITFVAAGITFASNASANPNFAVQAAWQSPDIATGASERLQFELQIPAGHKIYADSISVHSLPEGVTLSAFADNPQPVEMYDAALDGTSIVYAASVTLNYAVTGAGALDALPLDFEFMGCDETVCFPPMTHHFDLRRDAAATASARDESAPTAPPTQAEVAAFIEDFSVAGSIVGYNSSDAFINFLKAARSGKPLPRNRLANLYHSNLLLFILVLLGGGLLLNLTPCVLPMIPINLGIIGAGAQASSRGKGFLLGGAYGLGIALAYGALGLVSVLTGAAFGSLQSSPWFSLTIALVFVVLALAMFDVIVVDLSRFQSPGAPARAGTIGTALALGAISALLAGACVAPVLIMTLLLAADLHQAGNWAGLSLPFLLGVGMALPWPFAGAGLSFLPKPGGWMNRVKFGFGILVLLFALHYGALAWQGFRSSATQPAALEATEVTTAAQATDSAAAPIEVRWLTSLPEALAEARQSGQHVFVDLWANWCTACKKMDRSTLRDPDVITALGEFVSVKIQCENLKDPETKALMSALGASGLPTYVVLAPPQAEHAVEANINP